jgi:rhodanese-related sulfurtransferase
MTLDETPDWGEGRDTWGRCSGCEQIAMFESPELWEDLDREEIAALPSRQLFGPTGYPNTIPQTYTEKERLVDIFGGIKAPDYVSIFNKSGGPATISWITENIGVTSREGADIALREGHFVINTADEINNKAQVKIPIYHEGPDNLRRFKAIQNVMDGVLLDSDQKVVVHCAMGMERSVTAVVWYLANTTNMSLPEALKLVQSKRSIACDRLYFITR